MRAKKLQEAIQNVKINKLADLSVSNIQRRLINARLDFRYANFMIGKYFIIVSYQIDGKVFVSSNYLNSAFVFELSKLNKHYSLTYAISFIQRWGKIMLVNR